MIEPIRPEAAAQCDRNALCNGRCFKLVARVLEMKDDGARRDLQQVPLYRRPTFLVLSMQGTDAHAGSARFQRAV